MGIWLRVAAAVNKDHDQQQRGQERVYFTHSSISSSKAVEELKQGRKLGAGANAEVMKECCLLT